MKKVNNKKNKTFSYTNISKGISLLKKKGVKQLVRKLKAKVNGPNKEYAQWFEQHKATAEELAAQRNKHFEYAPCISIVVPLYNTPETYLKEMVESVLVQSYGNWQLCVADGSDTASGEGQDVKPATQHIMENYSKNDNRIVYRKLTENKGISENTNRAYELATGEYVAFFDHDDLIAPNCLYEIVAALNDGEAADMLYTDEDKITDISAPHTDPLFKPHFSIDLLRTHNYITHFMVVKKSLLDSVATETGLLDSRFDGAQDYDLTLRCVERTKTIRHIARVLYHWRISSASTAGDPYVKGYTDDAGFKALSAHLNRSCRGARAVRTDMNNIYRVEYEVTEPPRISVLIRKNDDTCTNDAKSATQVAKIGESGLNRILEKMKRELASSQAYNIEIIQYTNIKTAVNEVEADYILLLGESILPASRDVVSKMLGICMRADVGAVGGKLIDAKDKVINAGLIISKEGKLIPAFEGLDKNDLGYMLRAITDANVSAVSADCMMIKRDIAIKALENKDWCFETPEYIGAELCEYVRRAGLLVVYSADSVWRKNASKDTEIDRKTIEKDVVEFLGRWQQSIAKGDVYYNENLSYEKQYMLGNMK